MDRKTGPMSDAQREAYLLGLDHGYQDGHMAGFRSATKDDPILLWIMGILAGLLGWLARGGYEHWLGHLS
jgi:hypothetical protein